MTNFVRKCRAVSTGHIVEMAQSTTDLRAFRNDVLDLLRAVTRCDSALWIDLRDAFNGINNTPTGPLVSPPRLSSRLNAYSRDPMRYDDVDGLHRLQSLGGVATDAQVFTLKERDSLPIFTEVIKPSGIHSYITCVVEFHGVPLSRFALSRHTAGSTFRENDLKTLRQLRATIGIAEAALALPMCSASAPGFNRERRMSGAKVSNVDASRQSAELPRALTHSFGITRAEHRVLTLMERGLSNVEIAALLARSRHTIRNTLASAYRKLGVSRRAEAVFVLRTM
jgi:DNA-binding CsgD family transcriptional regulator